MHSQLTRYNDFEITSYLFERLVNVLSSPCLTHHTVSLGLVALCAADGGHDHGLPVALHDALAAHLRTATAPGYREEALAVALAAQMVWAISRPRTRPAELFFHLNFAMRVGEHSVRRLQAAAPGAMDNLDGSAAARWWRLFSDATRCFLSSPYLDRGSVGSQLGRICDGMWAEDEAAFFLLREPPAWVDSAVKGGALSGTERLLRRAGQAPEGPEAELMRAALPAEGGTLLAWVGRLAGQVAQCPDSVAWLLEEVGVVSLLGSILELPWAYPVFSSTRTCANPACTNLEGDSETDLKLLACRLCRAVGYCGQECQRAHWRAPGGHKARQDAADARLAQRWRTEGMATRMTLLWLALLGATAAALAFWQQLQVALASVAETRGSLVATQQKLAAAEAEFATARWHWQAEREHLQDRLALPPRSTERDVLCSIM
ncbi:hypothetical protein GPECTOR_91g574 [Gonium pectorale]|uniref:phytol kinase n=1 Tax=Gonium pectorale TaxID=33097 RepID=A0A150G287_GONPE|nr:hypothetical protein GPECTOR_91g574 [Gonium pectorale]|eukprot:KXZ43420.1 hypothetical protein GPECTOR_91g574 [Gonium pectorale]